MSHPSEALLLAFADHELEGDRRRQVEAHVQVCGLCRHALRDVEQAMAGLTVELALLDTAEPAEWQSLVAPPRTGRAGSTSLDALPVTGATRPRATRALAPARAARPSQTQVSWRWAAAMLLVIGGGAAAMTAPRWRQIVVTPAEAAAPVSGTPAARAVALADVAMSSAAVSILPVGGEATVVLTSTAGGGDGRVLVELSDRSDVQVTVSIATSEHATPRFTSAEGRLAVQLTGHGSVVRVAIPATLRAARITYDGAPVVTVTDGAVAPSAARSSGILLAARESDGTGPR